MDKIRRQLVTSGELGTLRDEGVSGVTSNPTIFDKAVSRSTDYDEALVRLVGQRAQPHDMLWELMLEDIRNVADVFWPLYEPRAPTASSGLRSHRGWRWTPQAVRMACICTSSAPRDEQARRSCCSSD